MFDTDANLHFVGPILFDVSKKKDTYLNFNFFGIKT